MSIADTIRDVVEPIFGGAPPVSIKAWDGSVLEADDPTAPTVILTSPNALRRLIFSPGEIGLSRAFVTGELDIDGDLADGFRRIWAATRNRNLTGKVNAKTIGKGISAAFKLGAVGKPLPRPASEAAPKGRLHSKARDSAVISHHYDLSNALYTLLLDANMAYSCAYWTSEEPDYTIVDAQRDKLDLICRKLDLKPGSRFLDVGCGWSSLSVHAAKEYGAQVTGVTISKEQLAFGKQRIEAEGVAHLVELRLQDYRDIPVSTAGYDAIAAIEMGEHVGAGNYPTFLNQLHRLVREQGRVLIQQMSHGPKHPGGGPFIERYIAPDMHMRPLHETVGLIEEAGFEVRDVHAMREHYVKTVDAWLDEFNRRRSEVVDLVGEEQSRVWHLYLVGGALAFEQNRMGVDQILSVKPTADGRAGLPATRLGWEPHSFRGAYDDVSQDTSKA